MNFNDWSKKRILEDRKVLTSRHEAYKHDPEVIHVTPKIEWGFIKRFLYVFEGANTPHELQEVIESIYHRTVLDSEKFHVHVLNVGMIKQRLREESKMVGCPKG